MFGEVMLAYDLNWNRANLGFAVANLGREMREAVLTDKEVLMRVSNDYPRAYFLLGITYRNVRSKQFM